MTQSLGKTTPPKEHEPTPDWEELLEDTGIYGLLPECDANCSMGEQWAGDHLVECSSCKGSGRDEAVLKNVKELIRHTIAEAVREREMEIKLSVIRLKRYVEQVTSGNGLAEKYELVDRQEVINLLTNPQEKV